MKDYDNLDALSNKVEKPSSTEPAEAGRVIAQLLHGSPEAPKPETSKSVETPPVTERKKRFDLGRMIAKVTGEAAPATTRGSHSEALRQKAEKLANDSETVKSHAEEELAEVSELELDRHIEAQDQALHLLKPSIPQPPPPPSDDAADEPADDAPTPISTVLANKSFDHRATPKPEVSSTLIDESPDNMSLYASYVKYGFAAAVALIILFILTSLV